MHKIALVVAIMLVSCSPWKNNQSTQEKLMIPLLTDYVNMAGSLGGEVFLSPEQLNTFSKNSPNPLFRLKYFSVTGAISEALELVDSYAVNTDLHQLLINQCLLDYTVFSKSDLTEEHLAQLVFPENPSSLYQKLFHKQQISFQYFVEVNDSETRRLVEELEECPFKSLFKVRLARYHSYSLETLLVEHNKLIGTPLHSAAIPERIVGIYLLNQDYYFPYVEEISKEFIGRYHFYEIDYVVETICIYRYATGMAKVVDPTELDSSIVLRSETLKALIDLGNCSIRPKFEDKTEDVFDRMKRQCSFLNEEECLEILWFIKGLDIDLQSRMRKKCILKN